MSQHLPQLSATRRTLLRTTAWSVPAVSLAAAAPAFATSGNLLGATARGQWGGNLPDGFSAAIEARLYKESGEASPPATLTLNLRAWPDSAFPLELIIAPDTDATGMPTGWLEPDLDPEPDPSVVIPGVVVVRVPGPTLTLHHGGGFQTGESNPLLMIIASSFQISSADSIPLGLTISDPAWEVAPTSATEVMLHVDE